MMMSNRRAKHRRFDYEPRFYDPSEDDRLKQRIRVQSKTRRGKRPSFLFLIILFALSLAVYFVL